MTPKTSALLLQTLRLRGSIASAAAQAAWSDADVQGLVQLMVYEGAEVWLYRRLRALEVSAPREFMDELRAAAQRVAVLAMRADAQTSSVLGRFFKAGIPCALIKGQARRAATGRYPYADARGVSDVDLLLPEERAQDGWELLRKNGYELCYPDPVQWSVTHHLPALWDENRVAVELHATTADTVPAAEAWRRATAEADVVTWNGASVSVPGATELLWQALAHAVRDGAKGCCLRAFLNVAAVLAENPPIRWGVIEERIATREVLDQDRERSVPAKRIHRWLATAADLAGTTLPATLGSAGRIGLGRLLLWRGKVGNSRFGFSVQDRLLEEGARSEAGLGLTPGVKGTGVVLQVRRRGASVAARVIYNAWRAGRG